MNDVLVIPRDCSLALSFPSYPHCPLCPFSPSPTLFNGVSCAFSRRRRRHHCRLVWRIRLRCGRHCTHSLASRRYERVRCIESLERFECAQMRGAHACAARLGLCHGVSTLFDVGNGACARRRVAERRQLLACSSHEMRRLDARARRARGRNVRASLIEITDDERVDQCTWSPSPAAPRHLRGPVPRSTTIVERRQLTLVHADNALCWRRECTSEPFLVANTACQRARQRWPDSRQWRVDSIDVAVH